MGAEARIKELGITLPQPPKPMGNYVPGVRVGNCSSSRATGPIRVGASPLARGKVGRDLSTEDAYKVAREVGINLLGSARTRAGQPRQGEARRQGPGHGELGRGLRRPAQGDQRLLGPDGGGLRRERPARPLRRRHGLELPAGIPVEIEMILEVELAGRPRREGGALGASGEGEEGREAPPLGEERREHPQRLRDPRAVPGQRACRPRGACGPSRTAGRSGYGGEVGHVDVAEAVGLVGEQDHLRRPRPRPRRASPPGTASPTPPKTLSRRRPPACRGCRCRALMVM